MPQQPGPPELVPVQLTLGTSQGTLQDWLLWPLATTPHEVESFAEALCRDLAVPPQFRRPVAETIAAQVKGWVENVPPPAPGLGPRRELVRLDVVLGDSLRLRDQFWWDLHASTPTPEAFAAELCADAGIDACHGAAVAAAIRIELGKLRRQAPSNLQLPTPRALDALAAGCLAAGAEPGDAGLECVYADSCLRAPDDWHEWGPSLHQLSVEEARVLQQQQLLHQRQQQQQQQQQQQDQLMAKKQAAASAPPQDGATPSAAHQAGLRQPPQRGDGDEAGGRRQARQRRGRASRLKELLRHEEEDESARSSGSGSAGAGAGAKSTARVAGAGGGSTASRGYQPDEDSLAQEALLDEEERRADTRHRASQARQRRRTSGAAATSKASGSAQLQPQLQTQPAPAPLLTTPQQHPLLPMQVPGSDTLPAPLLPGGGGMGGVLLGDGGRPVAGMVPVMAVQHQQPLPPGMVSTGGAPLLDGAAAQLAGGAPQVPAAQQLQMVGAAIVHFARELNMREDRIRAMLGRAPHEQLSLFRTLHQVVQAQRARQQEQLEAAALAVQGSARAAVPPPMPGPALGADVLPPPMPLPMPNGQPQQPFGAQQPPAASQFANMFSEMFD